MSNYFITGANGFIGKHLCDLLNLKKIPYFAGVRHGTKGNEISYGNLAGPVDWMSILKNFKIDVVVHLAARVHVMIEDSPNPAESYLKLNKDVTLGLASAAKKLGIKRFVFISTVKVNGEWTDSKPFSADDPPHPEDAHARSKAEAEKELIRLHEPDIFEVVIIRPPLTYGPDVKANFAKLVNLIEKNKFLPFGAVHNKRSLISVYNLCDLILACCQKHEASGKIFLASDDRDLSLRELILNIAETLNKKIILIPIPTRWMYFFAALIGKSSYTTRLFGNLHVDIEKTKRVLGWKPKYSFQESLRGTNFTE